MKACSRRQGDSNVVGMPLSMLLRNAGVAATTTCHSISYTETLIDSRADKRAAGRAAADACGPSLPGTCPATWVRAHAAELMQPFQNERV